MIIFYKNGTEQIGTLFYSRKNNTQSKIYIRSSSKIQKQTYQDYSQKHKLKSVQQYSQLMIKQTRTDRIIRLQKNPAAIRNISIVAHVDHGKTTLADCLISANGIISKKMAGQLKYLDDTVEEQDRGITMKSSSISLLHKYKNQEYLINLIDSPGHVQFGFEVSTALRLTDGALVVVDVLEGVSSQTYRVLLQTFQEKVSSILVLNKVDKLIREKKLSPLEAYRYLSQIIEQVNAILGSFINMKLGDEIKPQHKGSKEYDESNIKQQCLDEMENQYYFSAEKNNIVFCSAIDNWAFTVKDFAPLVAKKLNLSESAAEKYMWGEYYYYPKDKTVKTEPINDNHRPLCVDFMLQTVWEVYEKVFEKNEARIQKIIDFLKLNIPEKVKKNYDYALIKEILNAWLPLDKVVFRTVVEALPDPRKAQRLRIPILYNFTSAETLAVRKAVEMCDNSPDAPLVAFVSKMVSVPKANFNERGLNEYSKPELKTRSIGFARIFSGVIRRGQEVFVIGPKVAKGGHELQKTKVENIYLMMSQYPEGIEEVPAGNILGIANLEDILYKSGTLSNTEKCYSMSPISSTSKSILKVSVTTPNLENSQKLIDGLKKLNKSDPSVEVYIQKNGDIILSTCGQVHLERCVSELEKIFALVPVKYSDPIVNFRETIMWRNLNENNNEKIIQEITNKKKEQMKKELKERLKREALENAELDEEEKKKLKAIEDWDIGVEKYEADDLTETDTRYFLKTKEEEMVEKDKQIYKKEKEIKKVDHKNRGKMMTKQNFLNLSQKTNFAIVNTPDQSVQIRVKAIGFPFQIAEFLQKQSSRMKQIFREKSFSGQSEHDSNTGDDLRKAEAAFLQELDNLMKEERMDKGLHALIKEKLYCFGPDESGTNLLVIQGLKPEFSIFKRNLIEKEANGVANTEDEMLDFPSLDQIKKECNVRTKEILNSLVLGFDLAIQAGPLCCEPLMGVCFIIEDIKYLPKKETTPAAQTKEEAKAETAKEHEKPVEKTEKEPEQVASEVKEVKQGEEAKQIQKPKELTETVETKQPKKDDVQQHIQVFGPITGQMISTVKQGCLQSFLGGSPYLVEPVYECNLQTHEQYYGNVHSSLAKRRAKIVSEDLHECSNLFLIKAQLPVIQSFGFCSEMLTKTQGRVNAQLHFDTWKVYEMDPFYTPLTKEEIEQNGIQNVIPNQAKILIDKIRKNKGLITTEKIVSAPEKQRTLKKK